MLVYLFSEMHRLFFFSYTDGCMLSWTFSVAHHNYAFIYIEDGRPVYTIHHISPELRKRLSSTPLTFLVCHVLALLVQYITQHNIHVFMYKRVLK